MSKVTNQVSQEELEEKLSNVLMRQTDYNKEESIEKLRENNYNIKKIILEYMKIPATLPDDSTNTASQQRFKDFRALLK